MQRCSPHRSHVSPSTHVAMSCLYAIAMPKRSSREADGADDEERPRHFTRREDDARPSQSSEPPTVGQQTSYIKNKLARSEMYSKLKHKQKVRAAAAGEAAQQSTCPSCCCTVRCMQPRALPCCVAAQKQKRTERKKRQAEHAKAEREGLEPPPKQVPKVRVTWCSWPCKAMLPY